MSIRAFIAVPLPAEVKEAIHSLGRELTEKGLRIRLVRPEGIHCTLRFLGNIPESLVEEVKGVMVKAVEGITPTTLQTAGLGVFPNPARARVLWVGIKGNLEPLTLVHERLQQALEPLGFERENREFSPHLTIGRWKAPLSRGERDVLREALESHQSWKGGEFDLRELVLYRSQLHPSGARYTSLGRVQIER